MGSIRKSEYLTVSLCLLLNKFDVKFDECYHKKLSYFYNKEVMVSRGQTVQPIVAVQQVPNLERRKLPFQLQRGSSKF